MDRQEIIELVRLYQEVLAAEFKARNEAEAARVSVLLLATIDGKNAEARALQTEQALLDSDGFQTRKIQAELTEIKRRTLDAEIGLTKAWLYSQSGH